MNTEQTSLSLKAFSAAIKKANGQAALAMILGCSQSRVSRIADGLSSLDAEMAARIDQRVGVPKYDLRPDLFDKPKKVRPYPYEDLEPADVALRQHGVKVKKRTRRRGGAARTRSKPAKK